MTTLSDLFHNPAGVKALAIMADLPLDDAICLWDPDGLACDPEAIESWLHFHLVHSDEMEQQNKRLLLNWLLQYVDFKAAAGDMATYIKVPCK